MKCHEITRGCVLIGVVILEPTIGILQLFLSLVLRSVFRLEILFEINYNVLHPRDARMYLCNLQDKIEQSLFAVSASLLRPELRLACSSVKFLSRSSKFHHV